MVAKAQRKVVRIGGGGQGSQGSASIGADDGSVGASNAEQLEAALLLPAERDDEAQSGPWLDDPCYEVSTFAGALRDAHPAERPMLDGAEGLPDVS